MTQRILKGDDSAQISLTLADGFDYSGATVEVDYQGAARKFSNCTAGQTLQFSFTAEETAAMALGAWPVTVRINTANGGVVTVANAGAKIAVTDCVGEVGAGDVIAVDAHGGLYGVAGLPANYTVKDVRAKINEIIAKLGGGAAALCALFCVSAFGAGVQTQTAKFEDLPNGAQVVTNATLDAAGLATEAYVQQQISASGSVTPEIVTNVVKGVVPEWARSNAAPVTAESDPTVPEWAKAANPPMTMTTNAVKGIVTERTAAGFTEWTAVPPPVFTFESDYAHLPYWQPEERGGEVWNWQAEASVIGQPLMWEHFYAKGENNATSLTFFLNADISAYYTFTASRSPLPSRNALGLVETNDLSSAVSPITDGLSSATNDIAGIRRYLTAQTNAYFVVTNYESSAGTPATMQLYEWRDGARRLVWDQRMHTTNEIAKAEAKQAETNAAIEARIAATSNSIPSAAWGRYYPTGGENPTTNELWISTPTTVLSGGYEWQKNVTANGSLWVLRSNGIIADLGKSGVTNGAYLSITDWEGKEVLKVTKTASQIVDAIPQAVETTAGGDFVVRFFRTDAQPVSYVKLDLSSGGANFPAETREDSATCPATVVWELEANAWKATFTPKTLPCPSMFVMATYEMEGSTVIQNNAPIGVNGGMMVTNAAAGGWITVRPKWNGSTVVWESAQ